VRGDAGAGQIALVLHAHLPFVRHPEHERFLEEDWLYEAISECYLPLLDVFFGLVEDQVPFQLTLVLTPTLLAMLSDSLLIQRTIGHFDRLLELAEREVLRTSTDERFHPLALFYRDHFQRYRALFHDTFQCDIVRAFRMLAATRQVELITSAATHAFLPLHARQPAVVRAQIRTAVAEHQRLLGEPPAGIWLPECGYYEGLEEILADCGLSYFFCDAHGILFGNPRPQFGVYAPIFCPNGVAAFGRDLTTSRQVWSSMEGYPGDPEYREFYRDIGFDLDLDYIRPYIEPTGKRKTTGFKYYRITGRTEDKLPYRPAEARQRAQVHAAHFLSERVKQFSTLTKELSALTPLVVAPYDAELFGHWWFEGPLFLDALFRSAAATPGVQFSTPSRYRARHATLQIVQPALSSWGQHGYSRVWLNQTNDWIYPHLHWAAAEMIALANDFPNATGIIRRALNQAGRELMLAQSSDWAFIINMGTMVDYAVRRTKEHLLAFRRLRDELRAKTVDRAYLQELEARHNLFPDFDYRSYRDKKSSAT
jgi:1,4-alpha-glucan branching enzyme